MPQPHVVRVNRQLVPSVPTLLPGQAATPLLARTHSQCCPTGRQAHQVVLPIKPLLMNSEYTAVVTAAGGSAGMGAQPPGAPGPVHLGPVGPHTG